VGEDGNRALDAHVPEGGSYCPLAIMYEMHALGHCNRGRGRGRREGAGVKGELFCPLAIMYEMHALGHCGEGEVGRGGKGRGGEQGHRGLLDMSY